MLENIEIKNIIRGTISNPRNNSKYINKSTWRENNYPKNTRNKKRKCYKI